MEEGVGTGEGRGGGEAGQMGRHKPCAEGRMEMKTETVPERRAPSPGVDSPSLLHESREKGLGSLQERPAHGGENGGVGGLRPGGLSVSPLGGTPVPVGDPGLFPWLSVHVSCVARR